MHNLLAFVDPIAFQLGPIKVHWYGIIVVTGILSAIYTAERNARSRGLEADLLPDLSLWIVPFGVLGARLYEVFILQWPYYRQHPNEILAVWNGGLAIHGGVLLGGLVACIFLVRKKQPIWPWADCIGPGLILAQGIGRWGNFFNQEAYGSPAPNWLINLMPGWLKDGMTINGTVMHPTFLYESIWNFIVFAILMAYFRKKKAPGTTFALYLILYDVGRLVIESIREDSSFIFGGIRTAQFTAVVLIIVGAALYAYLTRRAKTAQEQPE